MIQIDEPHVDFSLHISPQPADLVTTDLGRRATQLRGAALVLERQGQSVDASTSFTLKGLEEVQEILGRGEKRGFKIKVFLVVCAADQRTLVMRTNRFPTEIRILDFHALP